MDLGGNKLTEETLEDIRSRIIGYEGMSDEEQVLSTMKVISGDFYLYCARNLVIKDKETQKIIAFQPNWAQERLVDLVMRDLAEGVPVRYIVLKARQMGLSTVIEALCYWWTATHKNINSVIIAHEAEAARNLYTMFKRYYEYSHRFFQPRVKYNTKSDLTFDIEDKEKERLREQGLPANYLASSIKTMVAKEGKGRGDTIHFFHGSEVAFWDKSADIASGALQALPWAPNTFAFLESTANGIGGYFYDQYQRAKKGEGGYKAIFFAWHEHFEYELEGKITDYDEEELELLEIFEEKGYAKESWDRKLLWRRNKRRDFVHDMAKFYQEYPKDDFEAFLASGRPVFETKMLRKMQDFAQSNTLHKFAEIFSVPSINGRPTYNVKFVEQTLSEHDPTQFKIWDLPEENEKYTIGVDVAEGKVVESASGKEGDFSVVDVMRQSDLKTVARWRGRIDPDLLGDTVVAIGTFYNHALVGCEINNHGLTTVQRIRNLFYRNLYQRESAEDDQFQTRTSKMGWQTNRKTKPKMINELVKAMREGDIIDYDIVFISECMTYVRADDGTTDAQPGQFDDCVIAKAINLQMTNWNSYDKEYMKENIHKPITRNGSIQTRTRHKANIRQGNSTKGAWKPSSKY